jgi:hypothetical protein
MGDSSGFKTGFLLWLDVLEEDSRGRITVCQRLDRTAGRGLEPIKAFAGQSGSAQGAFFLEK